MFILTAAKLIGGAVVGAGAKQIATTIVKQATPVVASKGLQAGYKIVGGLMIGGLMHAAINEYTGTIDRVEFIGKTIKKAFTKKDKIEEAKVVEETTLIEA